MRELYKLPCPTCQTTTDFKHNKVGDDRACYVFECENCGFWRKLYRDKRQRQKQVDVLQRDREW